MEDKVPVVIQGRAIQRERQAKRLERAQYTYRSSDAAKSESEPYALSALREGRTSMGMGKPRIRPRTGSRSAIGGSSLSSGGISPRRAATSRGEFRPRQRRSNDDTLPQNNPLLIKIAISALIALVMLLLNYIQLPFTQTVVGHVRTALTQEFDLDETLGKLKFVGDILPDEIKSVFGHNPGSTQPDIPTFASPVRGEVVRSFGEQVILPDTGAAYANQGIDILTQENAPFFASTEGVVAAVEEHEVYGSSVWLDHGNQIFTFYGNCGSLDVKQGDKVQRGQKLGIVNTSSDSQPILHFQIWMDNKPENPLEKISKAGQEKEGRGV